MMFLCLLLAWYLWPLVALCKLSLAGFLLSAKRQRPGQLGLGQSCYGGWGQVG
jgi:hypothetical protein